MSRLFTFNKPVGNMSVNPKSVNALNIIPTIVHSEPVNLTRMITNVQERITNPVVKREM